MKWPAAHLTVPLWDAEWIAHVLPQPNCLSSNQRPGCRSARCCSLHIRPGCKRALLAVHTTGQEVHERPALSPQFPQSHETSFLRFVANQRAVLHIHLAKLCPKQANFAGVHRVPFVPPHPRLSHTHDNRAVLHPQTTNQPDTVKILLESTGIGLCARWRRADTHVARCGPRCWWVEFWDLGGTQSFCQAVNTPPPERRWLQITA